MIFRIHYDLLDKAGATQSDSIVLEGDTIEEVRDKANAELKKRGGTDPWSEELEG